MIETLIERLEGLSGPDRTGDIYERIYRETHPRLFPFSPFERQRELRDLWPADQRKFRDMVDSTLRALAAGGSDAR
ncbi:MAG: hypothetical protein ACTHJQ_03350 [Rhizobiaceae bacterium]